MAKLKFKVIASRKVNGADTGETFEVSETNVGPGYAGSKKEGKPALNVGGLLLSNYIEPADAETQKWVYELGAGFEHFKPKSAQTEEKKEPAKNA
jgi:hypothetical protein